MNKRIFDIALSITLLIFFIFPSVLICLIIKLTSGGPVLYWSIRIGKNNVPFKMPKFRSMIVNAPQVATHLLNDHDKYITSFGYFLRKTSLDELPQLWSILKGDMSFVGPRPALFNQYDLIEKRTRNDVHKLMPGLTGLAQINGRDNLNLNNKVEIDIEYMRSKNLLFDILIIIKTIKYVITAKGISK